MSIHFISGKPGGGKSLYAVKLIVEELLYGRRVIITNLALRVPEMNAYLQAQYPGFVGNVSERVFLMDDAQTGEFWTYRPGGVRIKRLDKQAWFSGELPSYSGVQDKGVMYVIDEIHNYFGARQWAQTGQDVLFYLSQHRKLGDTVVCITQAINNVDKQFRSVTQDFTFLRNLSKETYGRFRLPGVFVRKTYTTPPTEHTQPMETGSFRLDVSGLAQCYDSAQGVGIHGRGADMTERKKGLSLVWYFGGVGLAAVLLFAFVPRVVAHVFSEPMKGAAAVPARAAAVSSGLQSNSAPVVLSSHGSGAGVFDYRAARAASIPELGSTRAEKTNEVTVTTFVLLHGVLTIGLSDHRVYRFPRDRAIERISDREVVIEGKAYPRSGF